MFWVQEFKPVLFESEVYFYIKYIGNDEWVLAIHGVREKRVRATDVRLYF